MVGAVPVGGDAPISVQTMTNSLTSDVDATMAQINAAAAAGADIVRVSCPDEDSTKALRAICAKSPLPIVADIHFHYRRAIEAAEAREVQGGRCSSPVAGPSFDADADVEITGVRSREDRDAELRQAAVAVDSDSERDARVRVLTTVS